MARGGRTPTSPTSHKLSHILMPKRVPSAVGLARARLMYSSTSCSSGVGLPESYSVRARTKVTCADNPTANDSIPSKMAVLRILTLMAVSYLPISGTSCHRAFPGALMPAYGESNRFQTCEQGYVRKTLSAHVVLVSFETCV
jgi:hypothetical protein